MVAEFLQKEFGNSDCERFFAIYIDNKNSLIGWNIVSQGTITETVVHPREIFKGAIMTNAFGLIVAHNHPSGNRNPSEADNILTRKIKEAGNLMEITILDHIIISSEGYFSFADEGRL